MKRNNFSDQSGFSLIEVLIAMVILAVGLLTLITMQTTGIKGNSKANSITVASDWGADRVEQLFAMSYTDGDLEDDGKVNNDKPWTSDGAGGLNNTDTTALPPDGEFTSPDGHYKVFWNIADNLVMENTKSIRVIIVRSDFGEERTVTMDYLKARYL